MVVVGLLVLEGPRGLVSTLLSLVGVGAFTRLAASAPHPTMAHTRRPPQSGARVPTAPTPAVPLCAQIGSVCAPIGGALRALLPGIARMVSTTSKALKSKKARKKLVMSLVKKAVSLMRPGKEQWVRTRTYPLQPYNPLGAHYPPRPVHLPCAGCIARPTSIPHSTAHPGCISIISHTLPHCIQ